MISTINEILDLFRFLVLDLVQVIKSSIWSGSWTWSRTWTKDLVEDLVKDLVQVLDLDRILTKSSVGQANGPDTTLHSSSGYFHSSYGDFHNYYGRV